MGIPCCLSRTSGTYTPAAVGPHPYTFNSQFVGALNGRLFNTLSSARITQCLITGYDRFGLLFGLFDFIMDDEPHRAMDVPGVAAVTVSPSLSPTTAAAAAAVDLYARRSCPRCGRRMSALKFDKHAFCVICRDVKCSLSTRCKECKAWSKDFMLGYVRHQRTLVTKGKRIPPSPSPSPPVTVVVTTSPDTSPTELFSEDRLRQLMQSMFRDLMPASIYTNPSSTAPPAVPDSATKYTEATGGLQSVTPFEAPMMESPGVVLPTTQVDLPPPHTVSVPFVDSSGLSNLGCPIISCVGLPINVSRGTDQLRVVNISSANVATVASVFSPGSLLFPFSDSGFASLSTSSSSRPFALPPPPPLSSSVALSSSSVSASASSSFSSSLPFSPSLPPPPSFPSSLPPTPSFPSQLAPLPPSSSFPSSSSFSASAALLPPPGFPPLPPPPGFAPLPPLLSPPLSSSSFPLASAFPSLSSSLPPHCVSFSAGVSPPVLSASSASSSFPSMDFASYQASMLGLSQDYQSLARWYSLSGGSDFRAYLSAFYPHLSSDASRDFSSGSSVFFSALRAVASWLHFWFRWPCPSSWPSSSFSSSVWAFCASLCPSSLGF